MNPPALELVLKPADWFADRMSAARLSHDTGAYIAGLMGKYVHVQDDMSKRSIILAFRGASEQGDFEGFQRIGDWVLWASIVHPDSLSDGREATVSVGRLSYHACHRIMRGSWPVYQELADRLPVIAHDVRCNLKMSGLTLGHRM